MNSQSSIIRLVYHCVKSIVQQNPESGAQPQHIESEIKGSVGGSKNHGNAPTEGQPKDQLRGSKQTFAKRIENR